MKTKAAKLTGYAPGHLNSLVRKKKLKAEKIGRNWNTRKEWVDEFLEVVSPGKKKCTDAIKN